MAKSKNKRKPKPVKQRKPRPVKSNKARVKKKQEKRVEQRRNQEILDSQNRRYQELLDSGLSPAIIARADLTNKELSKSALKDWRTRGKKLDELNRRGYTDIPASDLRLSWPRLQAKYPDVEIPADYKPTGTSGNRKKVNPDIRMTGPNYLYIGAAEVQGGFSVDNLSFLSIEELKDRINERISEAKDNPDGSDDLYSVYQVYYGSRNDCEELAKFYYSRGYNMSATHVKTVKERYIKITISNSYSQREFLDMVYTCITQMKNDYVGFFISKMKGYCRENRFPFMRGIK